MRLQRARMMRQKAIAREISELQHSTRPLIARAPLERTVREIARDLKYDIRFEAEAIDAIRTAADAYLHDCFERAVTLCAHRKRITVSHADIQIAIALSKN